MKNENVAEFKHILISISEMLINLIDRDIV